MIEPVRREFLRDAMNQTVINGPASRKCAAATRPPYWTPSMNTRAVTFDSGLAAYTVQDLCHPAELNEVIASKLATLTPRQFAHDRLTQGVRQMVSIIQDAVCGEYRGLTLTALADFLRALDYFMRWADRIPDTWEGGYVDDLQEVLRVLAAHRETVADYQVWLSKAMGFGAVPTRERVSRTQSRFALR